MSYILPILGSGLVGLATVGFLYIQYAIEGRIVDLKATNEGLVQKQNMALGWIEKSKDDRRFAYMAKQNLTIMNAVGVPSGEKDMVSESFRSKLMSAHTNAINAVISGSELVGKEIEEEYKKAEQYSEEDHLEKYMELISRASSSTMELQFKIDVNSQKAQRLERIKSILLAVCFAFQSIGLICGLVFLLADDRLS